MRGIALLFTYCVVVIGATNARCDDSKPPSEIRIGQTTPFSGPISASSTTTRAEAAYFDLINERGGINGRKIKFIALDDAYSPAKTVEQTRRLVEEYDVLAIMSSTGSVTGLAVQTYLNKKGVPQLLQISGSRRFNDPKQFRWTTPFYFPYATEAAIYARYILRTRPDAKIAVLHPNDELGREYYTGFREGLGSRADEMIVKVATYDSTSPTVDSQVAQLIASGANVFFNVSVQKFAAQSIRKARDLSRDVEMIVPSISTSIGSNLRPAGLENAKGIVSGLYRIDVSAPEWADDPEVREYLSFMKERLVNANAEDASYSQGYTIARLIELILTRCGDDLSRENILKQATTLKDVHLPLLFPGVKLSNSPEDYNLLRDLRLVRFDGEKWVMIDVEGR